VVSRSLRLLSRYFIAAILFNSFFLSPVEWGDEDSIAYGERESLFDAMLGERNGPLDVDGDWDAEGGELRSSISAHSL